MDAASDKRLNWVFHLIFLNAVVCCALTWATANGHIPWEVAFCVIAFCLVVLALAVNGLANLTFHRGQVKNFYEEMTVLTDLLKAMLAQTTVFMNLNLPRDSHVSLLNLRQELHCFIIALDAMVQLNGKAKEEAQQ